MLRGKFILMQVFIRKLERGSQVNNLNAQVKNLEEHMGNQSKKERIK